MRKSGTYALYQGKEYEITNEGTNWVELLSHDKEDLKKNFSPYNEPVYTRVGPDEMVITHNFHRYEDNWFLKVVAKNALQTVSRIATFAYYKGMNVFVRNIEGEMALLSYASDIQLNSSLKSLGFNLRDKGMYERWLSVTELGGIFEMRTDRTSSYRKHAGALSFNESNTVDIDMKKNLIARSGFFATYRGREYPVGYDADNWINFYSKDKRDMRNGFVSYGGGLYLALVDKEEISEINLVETYAYYKKNPFRVMWMDEENCLISNIAMDQKQLIALRFEINHPDEAFKYIPVSEIEKLVEYKEDALSEFMSKE